MKICILGTGFAALTAIKETRKRLPNAQIQVIGPCKELIYYPSLIWMPSGLRQADDLRIDLHNFFNRQRVEFIQASVTGLSADGRSVQTDQGEFDNEGLIIASGGRFIKKLPGIEHAITPCEGIPAAQHITDRLKGMDSGTIAIGFGGNPNEPAAMRGGPMFEFLFGIDTLLRQQGRRDKFKLVFFNPASEPGKRLGDKFPEKLKVMLAKKGIESHLGHKVVGFEANKVKTEGGELDADLILFMPGMTGPAWLDNTALPKSAGGMIKADNDARVKGMDKVYVAGDAGSFEGPAWQPKQAHAADIQAKTAAHNLTVDFEAKGEKIQIKHELICIVDTLSHGMLIRRTESGTLMLPPCRLMHYAKRFFEGWYLRQYR
ncbi:NAD(P)/FAD-dependent oxidoreductase [Thiomicrospira microaerophila]|uniref:NAD(P)/FAD-dependent oxidoreductase n=1 Tax=Thiomicrospira microaerophila TaxID=406020 RepID=UPI0005C9682F|nr:FAD-dependent oxidoreductase [Thiomicrospira microaerophila]